VVGHLCGGNAYMLATPEIRNVSGAAIV